MRIWDGFAHYWPIWAQMLPLYIGARLNVTVRLPPNQR